MTKGFTESVVEDATLDWLAELGYTVARCSDGALNEVKAPKSLSGEGARMKDAIASLEKAR
jgi:hypothetical protein